MEKILLCIIASFFIIGSIDYIEGNKFSLGIIWKNKIKNMWDVFFRLTGILSLIPFFMDKMQNILHTIENKTLVDSSIIIGSIFPMEMGGYTLSMGISKNYNIGMFSAIMLSAMLGESISNTIPSLIEITKNENRNILFKGLICGIISMPISFIITGMSFKIPLVKLIYNLLPSILLISIVISGMFFKIKQSIFFFRAIGRVVNFVSIIGIIVQGVKSICGIELIDNIMPMHDVAFIIVNLCFFLCGSYIMIEIIKRLLKIISKFMKFQDQSELQRSFMILDGMISPLDGFENFNEADYKTQIIYSAFITTGAGMLGMQLGYIYIAVPQYIGIFVFLKLLCGEISIIFAHIFLKCETKM